MFTFKSFGLALALAVTSVATPVLAQLTTNPTAAQIESDVRVSLKKIYQLQSGYMAEWGQFATTLSALNYTVPSFLSAYVNTTVIVNSTSLTVRMQGKASPVLNRIYTISEAGTLSGITQFANAHELELEINNLMNTSVAALEAYYAEWGTYSANLNEIGLIVPAYLGSFGTFSITLTATGYKSEFKGTAYPISGKNYTRLR